MAEEHKEQVVISPEGEGEVKDRGLLDFLGREEEKKKPVVGDDALVTGVEQIHIEEGEMAEEGQQGILEKLHRSKSSSSSSVNNSVFFACSIKPLGIFLLTVSVQSDEEEVEGEGGVKEKIRRKKKALKEKIEQKLHGGEEKKPAPPAEEGTTVVVKTVTVEETAPPASYEEEKKGFLEKIKEKLPGHYKKPVEAETWAVAPPPPSPAPAAVEQEVEGLEGKEKKGFLGKIMEKLPGHHKDGGDEGGKSSPASH
ncbi:Dehydrin COR410 [Apostasia shenzhenica]|uniref:Dehydrin COR410 n=1 Tax=Apostasia shenzhenica TaxID=1088818 RepID=A0A2I0AKF1_9ASPA|nr:Dehydrin COR410 [Apostasia shenzhenica]